MGGDPGPSCGQLHTELSSLGEVAQCQAVVPGSSDGFCPFWMSFISPLQQAQPFSVTPGRTSSVLLLQAKFWTFSQLPNAGEAFWFSAMLGRPRHCFSPPFSPASTSTAWSTTEKGRDYRRLCVSQSCSQAEDGTQQEKPLW